MIMATYQSYYLNDTAESNVNWFDSIPSVTDVNSVNLNGTLAQITNSDGTWTVFHGDLFGFSNDANGRLQGTIRYITHTTPGGALGFASAYEFATVGGLFDNINVDMTTFLLANAETRYDLVFNRPVNTINGDQGDNLLAGGSGADTFNGGNGANTVTYVKATGSITIDLLGINAAGGEAIGDVFNSIGHFIGTNFATGDSMYGNDNNNLFDGLGGSDLIEGRFGNDILNGGAGEDTIRGGGDNDFITGGFENDKLYGDAGADKLYGEEGNDELHGGEFGDELFGGRDDDTLYGEDGSDTMGGGDGSDTMYGGTSNDYMNGDAGNDFLYGEADDDTLNGMGDDDYLDGGDGEDLLSGFEGQDELQGGNGNDRLFGDEGIDYLYGGADNDQLSGGADTDYLRGGAGADTIFGGSGMDLIYGDAGADLIDGGDDQDTMTFIESTGGVTIQTSNPAANSGDAAGDTYANIEIFRLSNHDDVFNGLGGTAFGVFSGAGDDQVVGRREGMVINGGDGNDILFISGGINNIRGDEMGGPQGTDYLFLQLSPTTLTVNMAPANTRDGTFTFLFNGLTQTAYGDIDGVIGSNFNDTITGNLFDNALGGGNGIDSLSGGAGIDSLDGGNGGDNLWGGAGADQHFGGDDSGIDYARYDEANHGNLIIRLDAPNLNTGVAAGDTYDGIEGLVGGAGADTVVGNASANYLFGSGGSDYVYGQGGVDYLNGGAGEDNLWGGAGADIHIGGDDRGVDYARYDDANWGNLTLRLDAPAMNIGAVAVGDTYTGIEGLVGGLGNDVIVGNASNNFLFGSGGADYIDARAGSDYLNGGAGADRFVFATALSAITNVDRIADFAHGTDDIVLSQAIFAGIGTTLDASEFQVGLADTATDRIIYNNITGQLFYDSNGNGAGGQTLFATVTAGTVLDIGDFVMV
jgi:Ca2+-binding RTX toxin-like protein